MISEIERLRDRVDELEELLGLRDRFPRSFGLTKKESEFLGLLMKRQVVSYDQLCLAIWGGASESMPNSAAVLASKVRKKLRPFGVEIDREYCVGYFLSPDNKRRAAQLLVKSEFTA